MYFVYFKIFVFLYFNDKKLKGKTDSHKLNRTTGYTHSRIGREITQKRKKIENENAKRNAKINKLRELS